MPAPSAWRRIRRARRLWAREVTTMSRPRRRAQAQRAMVRASLSVLAARRRRMTMAAGGTPSSWSAVTVSSSPSGKRTPRARSAAWPRGRRSRVTTHTDEGTMGAEQLDILTGEGVPSHAIVVGHSCGSSNLDYHLALLDRGACLGFDRFGLGLLHPDRARTAALIGLLGVGFERQIVLSH